MVYLYCAELFETKLRSLAIAVSLTFGKLVGSLMTYLIYWTQQVHLHPMSCLWLIALLGLICSFLLPETKDQGILN